MSTRNSHLSEQAAVLTRRLLGQLFVGEAAQRVGVRLWDGSAWPDDAPRPASLVLNHPGALRAMLLPGTELGLAEAYLYNDFDIVGDIEAVFGLADELATATAGWRKKLVTARDLLRLPAGPVHPASRRGSAERQAPLSGTRPAGRHLPL
jgi:cyclopropane-fatty-acyl-phospholipid synthase